VCSKARRGREGAWLAARAHGLLPDAQASAADAAPHWEAFFARLREQYPISEAAAECFKAAATVHKFEKASKLVKPGVGVDFVILLLSGSVEVSAQGMREALPTATYSGPEFVCEHTFFAAEGLKDKIEVTASKAGGGMVAVLPFLKLQDALELQGQLVFPIMQMLGQNAMQHSRGEAVSALESPRGKMFTASPAFHGKPEKKQGHMEVFYLKRMQSMAAKTMDEAKVLEDQAAKAARVAHKAKNAALMLQKEAETIRSDNERLTDENREMVATKLEAVQLRRENAEFKELTEKHSTMLRESTREYFTEAIEKKEIALQAYRRGMETAEAKLKHTLQTNAVAIEKAGTADGTIDGLRRALESLQAAHTSTCAKLAKLQMSTTLHDLEKAQETIKEMEDEIDDLKTENEGLHTRLEELSSRLGANQRRMKVGCTQAATPCPCRCPCPCPCPCPCASTAWQAATLRAALGGPQANPARSDRLSEQRRGAKHTRGRTTSGGSGGGGGDNGDNGDNGGSSAEGRGGRAGELTNYVLTSLLAFTAADMLLTAAYCCSLLLTAAYYSRCRRRRESCRSRCTPRCGNSRCSWRGWKSSRSN